MRKRPLVILLAAVFAAEATGITGALHQAMVHCPPDGDGCGAAECVAGGGAAPGFQAQDGPRQAFHDPAHCLICQFLASFAAVPAAPSATPAVERAVEFRPV